MNITTGSSRRGSSRCAGAFAFVTAAALALTTAAMPDRAEACGCLSPPDPQVLGADDFAVNQQAEQIIFEVDRNTVTAHVLIRYAGDPEQFAWIVPVPNAPELDLSPAVAFRLLDDATRPIASVQAESLCPVPEYTCKYHPPPVCPRPDADDDGGTAQGGWDDGDGGGWDDDGNAGDTGGGDDGPPPGIDVIDMQQVGSYETVTFAATEAELAVAWLRENGFIVNETMTPYMMPYIEDGMVFVAAKLVAGAGIDAIEPLKITYQGTEPMIPLILTAVAAEPHLTVTAYIYGGEGFDPVMHPVMPLDPQRIAIDPAGRTNYAQVLARTVDEIGGNGWVVEYRDFAPQVGFFDNSGCCGFDDWCGIGGDQQCQCPTDMFDADDCGQVPGLLESVQLLDRLRQYPMMSRLTTRISPEEMNYDPTFRADPRLPRVERLSLVGTRYDLTGCEHDVMDVEARERVRAFEACATTYCGHGECVVTSQGSGCRCEPGFVARVYTELDGLPSITCVPEVPTVDLSLETELPDSCAGVDCGSGSCVDLGGVTACSCADQTAGVLSPLGLATCAAIVDATGTVGADNYTAALQDIPVCAPAPPECGQFGWLVPTDYAGRHGVTCDSSIPKPEALQIPPEPTCADYGLEGDADAIGDGTNGKGCGCAAGRERDIAGIVFGLIVLFGLRRRTRR